MTPHQRRVIGQLIGCRSGRYGSRTHHCQSCDHGQITLNSCGNRDCTRGGDDRRNARQDWMGHYLPSYVSGAAISDFRIQDDDGQYVTISYKDYRQDSKCCTERMMGEEFVRRFVMHFLPPHCKRIRYAGLYAPQGRGEKLEKARRLIAELHGRVLAHAGGKADAARTDHDDPEQAKARRSLFVGEAGNEPKMISSFGCRRMRSSVSFAVRAW